MNNNYYAIIMAGGIGSRFWPVSTAEFPKQFHDILGCGQTLIQKTFSRLEQIIPAKNILILTNEAYFDLVMQQLPMVHPDQVLLEPAMRNTAPCIVYAALKIQKANPEALMVVAPSDHWIEDEATFLEDLKIAFEFSKNENALMTLGIQPTFANTGYGYIEYDKQDMSQIKRVKQFREKPEYNLAKSFVKSGNFLWNGGIFIWSVASVLHAFEQFQPQLLALFASGIPFYNTDKERDFIKNNYALAENISIDYAVMELADNVYVLPARFDWSDLGTWGSLHEKLIKDAHENAVVNAKVILENTSNTIIRTDANKIVVIDGLTDFIIVDHKDILLIYPKSKEQEIKSLVDKVANA